MHKYEYVYTHKRGVEMNDKYAELKSMIKAMDIDERAIVLSCIPISEILGYVGDSFSKLQDTVSKIEAIAKGE